MSASIPIPDQLVVSMGEILWDVVGNQRHLGGAPLNFAYHCQALGARAAVISCISNDDLGADLLKKVSSLQVDCSSIQRNADWTTGTVTADVEADGNVVYSFPAECAWDHIHFTENARDLVDDAAIFNFGTLAQRCHVSKSAIGAAIASLPPRAMSFLDLNLRVPYYDRDVIRRSLESATVLKMNAWEFAEVKSLLHLPENDEAAIMALIEQYNLDAVAVTLGPDGAYAYSRTAHAHVEGYDLEVADTVGCGDAFSAAFALYLRCGDSLQTALDVANAAGGFVATQQGPTPLYTRADLESFRINHPRPIRATGVAE